MGIIYLNKTSSNSRTCFNICPLFNVLTLAAKNNNQTMKIQYLLNIKIQATSTVSQKGKWTIFNRRLPSYKLSSISRSNYKRYNLIFSFYRGAPKRQTKLENPALTQEVKALCQQVWHKGISMTSLRDKSPLNIKIC